MTIQEAKNKLTAWCKDQVGYAEGYNNYNKYATGRYSAYGWDVQNQPWCDVFVDAGFVECFGIENAAKMTYQPIGGFSAACRYSAQYYKNNGAWYSAPEPGDQIFFYYDGDINHTVTVKGGYGGVKSDGTTIQKGYEATFGTLRSDSATTANKGGSGAHSHGNTGTASSLPPYLAVYMWKRTA